MTFPRKFKHLIEIEKMDVVTPSHLWLTYCVCAVKPESCGWGGWTIEAVFSDPYAKQGEHVLNAQNEQRCPRCGGDTFRTGASYRFDLSDNQTSPIGIPGIDYNVVPIEYTDDESTS
jgi:hypothetical protein